MKERAFGSNDVRVTEVGLGTWQIGGGWGEITDETAMSILSASVEAGVRFFDTADVYGSGRSESLIGQFLKGRSERIFVATKLGRRSDPGWPENFTSASIRAHTEDSLKRLGVEALDLTQLHCIPTEELRKGEVFDTLRALQKEGKIRRFGASVESMEEALICLEQDGVSALQIIFNIFRQKPIDVLFPKAREKRVALLVRLPLASGLLSGKMTKDTHFAKDDHRNFNQDGQFFNVGETFAGVPFEKGVEFANQIKSWVPSGMTMAQMSLRWCLDFDAVSVIIPGASRPDQARSNAAVSDLPPLSKELHETLSEFYRQQVAETVRGAY